LKTLNITEKKNEGLSRVASLFTLRTTPMWKRELRIGAYRVFYDFEANNIVKIIAVGHKVHNNLYIRGKKVEL
jgi:mRNA-degrading endonuclease RelE of RelBE toxin-antitoxin system